MPGNSKDTTPEWKDVQEEAEKLAKELLHDSFSLARRALHLADRVGSRMVSTTETLFKRAEETWNRRVQGKGGRTGSR
jgi:hypothetical protein